MALSISFPVYELVLNTDPGKDKLPHRSARSLVRPYYQTRIHLVRSTRVVGVAASLAKEFTLAERAF